MRVINNRSIIIFGLSADPLIHPSRFPRSLAKLLPGNDIYIRPGTFSKLPRSTVEPWLRAPLGPLDIYSRGKTQGGADFPRAAAPHPRSRSDRQQK